MRMPCGKQREIEGWLRDVHVSPELMRPNFSLATFETSSSLTSAHGFAAQRKRGLERAQPSNILREIVVQHADPYR